MVLKAFDSIEDLRYDDEQLLISAKVILDFKKIKKLNFPSVKEKIESSFEDISKILNLNDTFEGYFSSYSETEFLAYKFYQLNGIYPNLLKIENIDIEKFVSDFFKHINVPENAYKRSICYGRGDIKLSMMMFYFKSEDMKFIMNIDSDEIIFLYDKHINIYKEDNIFFIILGLLKKYLEPKVPKNKIYIVYKTTHGFDKKSFDIKKFNISLEENYNDGFPEISEKIIKGLNDKKKTYLVILNGDPGVGKTMYLRYMAPKLKKNIIFISPDTVEYITDPTFITFLMKNDNSILIIEDADPALKQRNIIGRTSGVSNVLNLTDGLLSDCLNISIVATFNTSESELDPALLRKGRLLMNYKFNPLELSKSKKLLEKLGVDYNNLSLPVKGMKLCDIYYYGEDNRVEEKRKIGF